jgi:hypothetical protein
LALFTAVAVALGALDMGQGGFERLREVLETAQPFRSWWYSLVLCFAATTALATAVEGVRARREVLPIRMRATVPAVDGAVVAGVLRRRLGRVAVLDDGSLVAERGGASRWGRPLAGAGGLALCAGIAIAAHLGVSGTATVLEGATVYDFAGRTALGVVRRDLGAELEVRRQEGEDARGWRLTVARGPDILARADLLEGESFEAEGRRYRLASVRVADAPARFLVSVGGKPARPLAARDPVEVGPGQRLELLDYDRQRGKNGPAVRMAWGAKEGRAERGWVFPRYPEYDARVRRSASPVRVAGYERRMELWVGIEEPQGRALLVIGAVGVLLGLLLLAGRPYARFTARLVDGDWVLVAQAARNAATVAAELDEIAAPLRAAPPAARAP